MRAVELVGPPGVVRAGRSLVSGEDVSPLRGNPNSRPPSGRSAGSIHRVVTTLPRVKKCTPSGAVGVGVAEERALPAAEGVVRHRDRDRHVDADHPDLDVVLEPAGRAAVVGEHRGAVAVVVGVDQRDRLVVRPHADDRQHRAEDLLAVDVHLRASRGRTGSGRARSPSVPAAAATSRPSTTSLAPAASPDVDQRATRSRWAGVTSGPMSASCRLAVASGRRRRSAGCGSRRRSGRPGRRPPARPRRRTLIAMHRSPALP